MSNTSLIIALVNIVLSQGINATMAYREAVVKSKEIEEADKQYVLGIIDAKADEVKNSKFDLSKEVSNDSSS